MESVNSPIITELRKTPLNGLHRRMGAKMVNFGGWDMPVEYPSNGGLVAEHKAVRSSVGVFDVSHMGDIRVCGRGLGGGCLAAVQHISINDASRLAIGQAHYSALLYPEGTFVDDVIVHRLGEDDFLLVINAGTREKDVGWVRSNTKGFDCSVEDLSDTYTQLAIQGPRAVDVLRKLTDANLDGIKNYWFTHGMVCGLRNTLIARTGYTGEDGFDRGCVSGLLRAAGQGAGAADRRDEERFAGRPAVRVRLLRQLVSLIDAYPGLRDRGAVP
jgi:aminomethyltransferase